MTTVTIRQTVELAVDLNAYYDQFPPALRRQIDAAVLALASGSPRTETPVPKRTRGFSSMLPDDTLVYLDPTRRPRKRHGTVTCLVNMCNRISSNGTQPMLLGDLKEALTAELDRMGRADTKTSTHLRNLFQDGYLMLEEPHTTKETT